MTKNEPKRDSDKGASLRNDLHLIKGPLRCGGPRGLGGFYGRYWPRYFRALATDNAPADLTEEEKANLEESLREFETDFKRLAEAQPTLHDVIARAFINSALIAGYLSREDLDDLAQLREEIWRDTQRQQAGIARAANTRENRPEWKVLINVVKAVCKEKKLQMSITYKYADTLLLEPAFWDHLKTELGEFPEIMKRLAKRQRRWPGTTIVRDAIKTVLEEPGKSQNGS